MPFPLPGQSRVRVAFAVPGGIQRMKVDGRVQWRAPAARGFSYGMEFVDLRPEAQLQIDAFVRAPGAVPAP